MNRVPRCASSGRRLGPVEARHRVLPHTFGFGVLPDLLGGQAGEPAHQCEAEDQPKSLHLRRLTDPWSGVGAGNANQPAATLPNSQAGAADRVASAPRFEAVPRPLGRVRETSQ